MGSHPSPQLPDWARDPSKSLNGILSVVFDLSAHAPAGYIPLELELIKSTNNPTLLFIHTFAQYGLPQRRTEYPPLFNKTSLSLKGCTLGTGRDDVVRSTLCFAPALRIRGSSWEVQSHIALYRTIVGRRARNVLKQIQSALSSCDVGVSYYRCIAYSTPFFVLTLASFDLQHRDDDLPPYLSGLIVVAGSDVTNVFVFAGHAPRLSTLAAIGPWLHNTVSKCLRI